MLFPIVSYLLFGAVFGLLTYRKRHLFGEGPSNRENADPEGGLAGRSFWVLMNCCLWPVSLLAGAYGLARRYWK